MNELVTGVCVVERDVLCKHRGGSLHKTALRILAKKFLSWEIWQSGNGHDSIGDARATLRLQYHRSDMQVVLENALLLHPLLLKL